jgi:hypothetical protein
MSRPNILVVTAELYKCRPTNSGRIKLRFTVIDNKITDNHVRYWVLVNRREYSERHYSVAVQNTSLGIMSRHTASVAGRMANETATVRLRKGHVLLIELLFQNPAKGTGKKKSHFCQNSDCSGRESNRVPCECKTRELPLR